MTRATGGIYWNRVQYTIYISSTVLFQIRCLFCSLCTPASQLSSFLHYTSIQHLLALFVKVGMCGLDKIGSLFTDHVHNVLDTAIGDEREY